MVLALCSGCGLGECIDLKTLAAAAAEDFPGLVCFTHPALCSEAGIGELVATVSEQRVDRVSIGACSPRCKSAHFDLEGILTDRVNLREQVAWLMEPGGEDTRMCAGDQVRMSLARLSGIDAGGPYVPEDYSKEVLVVGGGITGLTAALQGAEAGYRVHLVEKEASPGGYAGRLCKMTPEAGKKGALREPDIDILVRRVTEHPEIEVHLESVIGSISGEPGNFSVRLENGQQTSFRVGAVVLSTGWKPYDPGRLGHLGYGASSRVRTLEEFEKEVQEEGVPGPVLFILCAGSRDPEHLPYCSTYCCTAALKQALYVREKDPDANVYIVYRDIRTPGFQEEFYQMVQSDDGIFLTRGKVEKVEPGEASVLVTVGDTLLGGTIVLEASRVVLATGMVPSSTGDLQLQYRLGKGLPELEYDFSDSHFICFPYETRRTGIYAAGTVRSPMDMDSSREDGAGAMLKAIQCIECTGRGEAVHPRSGDSTFPELYMERCTDCKRCTEECPFGSYDETEKGTPLPHPARCRRCGICMGSCPERVIGFRDYSINSVSAMIRSVQLPDEFEEKPRILVFVCENDAYPALDGAGFHRMRITPSVRIIPVRCLGSINRVWISDALSHGFDGILQIGCIPGDETQCHFIQGSELTEKRGENLRETLETMMLEPERICTRFVEINDHHGICRIINDYAEQLALIGPNPFKGM